MIDEGIVDKPSDLDVATVMSMGFPAYRYAFSAAVTFPQSLPLATPCRGVFCLLPFVLHCM